MAIHKNFRKRFMEQQEKNRSDTEDLFLEILSSIGEEIKYLRKCLLLSLKENETEYRKILLETHDMLKRLEDELL